MANKKQTYSTRILSALQNLGRNLEVARLVREMSVEELASRAGVSAQTVKNIEKGKPGISVGNLAKILVVMQELDQLEGIMDDSSKDPIADIMKRRSLPKRVRRRSRVKDIESGKAVESVKF
ncbi:helix-turn-helix transcriptional regulator [Kordiimonas lacus]|uniref:Helix-turn-helix n=1 Tax=Kordiimonas lacus TaxID=637679 RepID=A0A1G6TAG4_9PROT|nr:helix-turn-helix transcriptional regulator [Kordiimonas lacus]SDD25467.1 Helix-turn-helix [Kordiimonas lacus]